MVWSVSLLWSMSLVFGAMHANVLFSIRIIISLNVLRGEVLKLFTTDCSTDCSITVTMGATISSL